MYPASIILFPSFNKSLIAFNYSQEVGWREDALKLVFIVTDQTFKIAGDGKVM